jgi:hypothetical protein
MTDVSRFIEALGSLMTQAEAIAAGPTDREEERAFLDLLEPTGVLLRQVPEWLELADEGECTWLAFLESHPELDSRPQARQRLQRA